jgi:ABC-2 type transport system ATP-binding protein
MTESRSEQLVSSSTKPMLEAVGLSKSFGENQALSNLDLQVRPGEIFCLLGPNGAGKTTTLSLFLGFVTPSSGVAKINGIVVHENPDDARRCLSFVPENVMLYGELTGIENLAFFHEIATGKSPSRETVITWLSAAGLQREAMDRPVERYSKGMRQKVGLAIARAKAAKALVLDEPTSGLDPQASNELSISLEQLKSDNVAILMATHDIFRAHAVGTHIGILRNGRLVSVLEPSDIKAGDLERLYLTHMST